MFDFTSGQVKECAFTFRILVMFLNYLNNHWLIKNMSIRIVILGLALVLGTIPVRAGNPSRILLCGQRLLDGTGMTRPEANALRVQLNALGSDDLIVNAFRGGEDTKALPVNQDLIFLMPDWVDQLSDGMAWLKDTLTWYEYWVRIIGAVQQKNPHSRYILCLPPRMASADISGLDSIWQALNRPKLLELANHWGWETVDLHLILTAHPEYWQDDRHLSSIGAGVIARRFYETIDQQRFAALKVPLPGTPFDYYGYSGMEGRQDDRIWRIVSPKYAAAGHPWIWRMRFWGNEPQTEIALLERGYYLVYCDAAEWYGNEANMQLWDWFYYQLLAAGLAQKGILEGFSRGGMYAYRWMLHRPESVAGVYADAPVLDMKSWPGGKGLGPGSQQDWDLFKKDFNLPSEADAMAFTGNPLDQVKQIADLRIPLLHVVGDADKIVPVDENTNRFVAGVRAAGGDVRVIHKPGIDHHPHSLPDPTPIVNFVQECYGSKINWAALPAPGNEYRSAAGWQAGMEWHSLFTEMNALSHSIDSVDMLLFGNSITQSIGGPGRSVAHRPGEAAFTEAFRNWEWYNFGISGDRTQHLRWRIRNGSWAALHPKYVVITIGVNNIPTDQAAEIFQGITGIVEDIRAKDSWVKILVVGPLPTKDRTSENRRSFDHVHKLLAAFPFPEGAIYDPLAYGLLDANGDLPANYFSKDGIHLLPDGYAEYARLLRKALEQMHE